MAYRDGSLFPFLAAALGLLAIWIFIVSREWSKAFAALLAIALPALLVIISFRMLRPRVVSTLAAVLATFSVVIPVFWFCVAALGAIGAATENRRYAEPIHPPSRRCRVVTLVFGVGGVAAIWAASRIDGGREVTRAGLLFAGVITLLVVNQIIVDRALRPNRAV
jgi:hypothetical protein